VGVKLLSQPQGQIALSGRGRTEQRQYAAQSTAPSKWWGAAFSILACRNVPDGW
jgi:hypothetical protein